MVNEGSPSRLMCDSIPPIPPKEEGKRCTDIRLIHSFIHIFSKCLLRIHCMPGILPGMGIELKKEAKSLPSGSLHVNEERQRASK